MNERTNDLADGPLVRAFWQDFLNADADEGAALSERVTREVQFRGSLGVEAQGVAGIVAYCRQAKHAFRGFHAEVGQVIREGDDLVCRLLFSGEHQAELFGVPASGKHIKYDGMAWMQLQGARFSSIWVLGDAAEWMTQFQRLTQPDNDG